MYIADCLATCVTPIALSHEELPYHLIDVYSLNRKRKPKSSGERSSGTAIPPTKVARTSGLLRDITGPKAEAVSYESARPYEVTPSRHHGKSL